MGSDPPVHLLRVGVGVARLTSEPGDYFAGGEGLCSRALFKVTSCRALDFLKGFVDQRQIADMLKAIGPVVCFVVIKSQHTPSTHGSTGGHFGGHVSDRLAHEMSR